MSRSSSLQSKQSSKSSSSSSDSQSFTPQPREIEDKVPSEQGEIIQAPRQYQKTDPEYFIKDQLTLQILNNNSWNVFTQIQHETYKHIFNTNNIVVRTNVGKTLSFIIPIVQRIRAKKGFDIPSIKVLILQPNKDQAYKSFHELLLLRHTDSEFKVAGMYEGMNFERNMQLIINGADFIVCTTSLLVNVLEKGLARINYLQTFVIDSIDDLLRQGLNIDLQRIFDYLSKVVVQKHQNIIYTANVTPWLSNISQKYFQNHQFIQITKTSQNTEIKTRVIEHIAIPCPFVMRMQLLSDVITCYSKLGSIIIYCEDKGQITFSVLKGNIKSQTQIMASDLPLASKEICLKNFKQKKFRCLIISGQVSKQLKQNIPDSDLVILMEPPKDIQTFVSRSSGVKNGFCVMFYSKLQVQRVEQLERQSKMTFKRPGPPQQIDIIQAVSKDIIPNIKKVPMDSVSPFMELAKQMISMQGGNSINALSKTLAYITGTMKKIPQRSLLCSIQGFVTYTIKFPTNFESLKNVYSLLDRHANSKLVDSIKGMKRFQNNIVGFDVPEQLRLEMERCISKMKLQLPNYIIQKPINLANLIQLQTIKQKQEDDRVDQESKRQAFRRKKELQIYIGGVPYNADEYQIQEFFKKKNVISVQVRLLRNQNNQSRGSAFLLTLNDKHLKRALNLDNTRFGTRNIKVNLAAKN